MTASSLMKEANMAVAKGDMTGAVRLLSEAMTLDPKLEALWSNRSFALGALGRHNEALSDARTCIELNPASSKGYLRAGRALLALGRVSEASQLLESAVEAHPQDYSLREALITCGSSDVGDSTAASVTPAASSAHANPKEAGGLASSYYYAAVPASARKLPVQPPPRIEESGQQPSLPVASGHIKHDLERKGEDSYYYAHARQMDYTVPTVPKKINPDGSLSEWRPASK
jgi:tetratricopeptide (TPR) repeat protein